MQPAVADPSPPFAESRHPSRARGYKPGTRQIEEHKGKNAVTGELPWWTRPRGDAVWHEKADQFKKQGGADNKNIIGWNVTGLTGGTGR